MIVLGKANFYGNPRKEKKLEVSTIDGDYYIIKLIDFYASQTNRETLWKGADSYKIVRAIPDISFTSIDFDFDSSSGTYDRICFNNSCKQNFIRVSDSSSDDGSLFCPLDGLCYSYTEITDVLEFLPIGETNFLVSVAKVSDAWVTSRSVIWINT